MGMKMQKSFFAHIFVKSGSIYVNQSPKWSTAHSTHFTGYILYFTSKNASF